MNRQSLIKELELYQGEDSEQEFKGKFLDLLRNENACFMNNSFVSGHITSSGFLINGIGDKVLLNHHRSLNKWLNFGGHADGEEDTVAVAKREVIEESGIENINLILPNIFDIDIHKIPMNPRNGKPEHYHFDLLYIFQTIDNENYIISHESTELRWCNIIEARDILPQGQNLRMDRLFSKWQKFNKDNKK